MALLNWATHKLAANRSITQSRTFMVGDLDRLTIPTAGKLDPKWEGGWVSRLTYAINVDHLTNIFTCIPTSSLQQRSSLPPTTDVVVVALVSALGLSYHFIKF